MEDYEKTCNYQSLRYNFYKNEQNLGWSRWINSWATTIIRKRSPLSKTIEEI